MKHFIELLCRLAVIAVVWLPVTGCEACDMDFESNDSPGSYYDDDDDDDDAVGCNTEILSDAFATAELGAIDSDNPDITADVIADACLARADLGPQCIGWSAKLVIGFLSLLEEMDGILSLLGGLGLKSSTGFVPAQGMNVGDILEGFIAPIEAALERIDVAAEELEALGCGWIPSDGVQISMGSSPTGMLYIRGRLIGGWGEVEARLLGSMADLAQASLDFVLSHDLNFDLTSAISKFGEIDEEQCPENLPALIESLQWLFIDNPDFLNLADPETFAAIPVLLTEAIEEALSLHRNGTLYNYSTDHVISVADFGQVNILDGGDIITIQFEFTEDFRDVPAGMIDPITVPACDNEGNPIGDSEFCLSANVMAEAVRVADEVILPSLTSARSHDCNGDAGDGCLKLSDFNAIALPLGWIDYPLPPVIEIDPIAYFFDPQGVRYLILDDYSAGSTKPITIEGETAGDCSEYVGCGDYIFAGDSSHFSGTVAADGIIPAYAEETDLLAEVHGGYVLPYFKFNDCAFNGALWTNLAGFAAGEYSAVNVYPSIWGADYAAGEPDVWDNGENCNYNFNKLLAIAIKELGWLEAEEE